MRVEKTYDGIKTVLEGKELERLLERFQVYDMDYVQRYFETDDTPIAMKMTAYKVYADLYPAFEADMDNINNLETPDSRNVDLFFRTVLYLAVKCLYPTIQSGIFFDENPAAGEQGSAWTGPGTYFGNLSQKIRREVFLRSALREMGSKAGSGNEDSVLN